MIGFVRSLWVALLWSATPGLSQTPQEAAWIAIGAFDERDFATVDGLASGTQVDPWLVADALIDEGRFDVARMLAEEAGDTVHDVLLAYVEAARESADARSALRHARDLLQRADAERRRGDLRGSLARYQQCASAAERLEWHSGVAEALRGLGWCSRRLPDGLETAVDAWTRAAEIEDRLGPSPRQALSLLYQGNGLGEQGLLSRARASLERAVEICIGLGDLRAAARCQLNLGVVHERQGRPGAAASSFDGARRKATSLGDVRLEAHACSALVEPLGQLGDLERAMKYAERAVTLWSAMGRDAELAQAHGALGISLLRAGDQEAAIQELEHALSYFEASGDQRGITSSLLNLGLSLMESGDSEAGLERFETALERALEQGDIWDQAQAHFHLSRAYLALGELQLALESDEELLRIGERLKSARLLMRGHLNAAKRLLAADEPAGAMESARDACRQMGEVVAGLGPLQGARARDYRWDIVETTLRAALATGEPGAVFWSMERARSQALVEAVGGRDAISEVVLDRELVASVEAARDEERAALQAWRAKRDEPGGADTALAALERARAGLREVLSQIERSRRAVAAGVFSEPVGADELQRTLGGNEAFVSFALLDAEALACVVTRSSVRVVPLGPAADLLESGRTLGAASQGLRGIGISPTTATWEEVSARMRARLVDPLELPDAVERVYVSPTDLLAYLPLAAVVPGREIVHAPSATVLQLLRERPPIDGRDVLAFGAVQRQDLPHLPATRAEAESVGTHTIVGEDATEERLVEKVARDEPWRAVHLACHATVDPDDPLASVLYLTPSEHGDGNVTVMDVFGWSVDTELVVLSACETGIGELYRADGVFGFTRAFLSAGARQVLVSLWPVDDEATRVLMTRLYELWNPEQGVGVPLATALRLAQEHLRSHPRWESPEYWAAWQIWGTGD